MLKRYAQRLWQIVCMGLFGLFFIPAALSQSPADSITAQSSPLLSGAQGRPVQSLSGEWTYSIDPYRDGVAGFHGGPPGQGYRRYNDIDVQSHTEANPGALFEYDLDRSSTAQIPGSWLAAAKALRHYQGLIWYQRRFDADLSPDTRQILRFGAVNYAAKVYLNGEFVGQHEGGFTPFSMDVTDKLRADNNRLVVGVDSERSEKSVPPPVTDWETYGGITRDVELISVPQTHIDMAWIRLDADGRLAAEAQLAGADIANALVTLTIPELGLSEQSRTDNEGFWSARITAPETLQRWSPDTPRLYKVSLQSRADEWTDRIGFRTVSVQGQDILLNGEPIFLRGISLHEEELGANPARRITEETARALLEPIKSDLNANFVRLAHYPHSDIMTRMADELGLLVWSEIPVYWRIAFDDPDVLAASRNMLAENILRDRNRASIVLWSVGNETPISEARNDFLAALAADVRRLDKTRLVTAALLTERETGPDRPVMVMSDPLVDYLDVMAINTYNGWYSGDPLSDLPQIGWDTPQDKPLIFSELGAGAKTGFSDPAAARKFSEEFQAEYYRQTLAMAETIPNLAGLSPWIYKDFRSPRRQHPVLQEGWNRKGLISETGERKPAFNVLAQWYARQESAAAAAD